MKYSVMIDDNFHYMDESERYCAGEFDSLDEAIMKAKEIVERSLDELAAGDGQPEGDELYAQYTTFGEDPFIMGAGEVVFSAWDYARERCRERAKPTK